MERRQKKLQKTALKPGDVLYYVEEFDPPGAEPHTWKVRSDRVKQVRVDGFVFDRLVGFRRIHRHSTIGSRFHQSPNEALQAFAATQQEKIASAQRAITEAERGLAWTAQMSAPTLPDDSGDNPGAHAFIDVHKKW